MKNVSLRLNIPTPCTEDWGKMNQTDRGRFCENCSKHVTDFTNFTDQQLKDYFSKNTGHVCGRLTQEQVHRELAIQEYSKHRFMIPRLFVGVALAAGLTGKADAQEINAQPYEWMDRQDSSETAKQNVPEPAKENSNYIFGRIVGLLDQEGVPFASISVKDANLSAVADIDGNFKFKVPDEMKGQKVTLIFASVGYEKRELEVLVGSSPLLVEVVLNQPTHYVTVGIIISDVKPKKTFWQRIFHK